MELEARKRGNPQIQEHDLQNSLEFVCTYLRLSPFIPKRTPNEYRDVVFVRDDILEDAIRSSPIFQISNYQACLLEEFTLPTCFERLAEF